MVGLDIGSKTVKVVELEKDGNSFKLVSAGVVAHSGPTPDKFTNEAEIGSLAQVIKKLFEQAKISSNNVAVALPEQEVYVRTIKFPGLTDIEIASAVKWESEEYIPIPKQEAIIQYQILERRENTSPPEVVVLLVAAAKELSEKYVKTINAAGLSVVSVETELMALSRSLAPLDKTVLLVDFGARSTDIGITKHGNLYFSRSIPTGGEAFTRAVAQGLGVNINQAEEYKIAYGLSSTQLEGKIKGVIDPVFRLVADEIKKAIHYFQSEEKEESPAAVILSGGTTGMPEAVSALSELLGLEVVVGNPFSKVNVDAEVAKSILPYSPLYSIAMGLAMRE